MRFLMKIRMNYASNTTGFIHGKTGAKHQSRDSRERRRAFLIRQRYLPTWYYQQHTNLRPLQGVSPAGALPQ